MDKVTKSLLVVGFVLVALFSFCAGAAYQESYQSVGTYTQFGTSTFIIDTRTGKLCDAFPSDFSGVYPLCGQISNFVEQHRRPDGKIQ